MENLKGITSVYVEAREYFDKSGGNSYFSARIYIDGDLCGYLPFQYGYGSQYETEAIKWLRVCGYIDFVSGALFNLKKIGIAVYQIKYPATMRDTKRFGVVA